MNRYFVDRDVVQAEGAQTFVVEAATEEEAKQKFLAGEADIECSEVEVIQLDDWDFSIMYLGEQSDIRTPIVEDDRAGLKRFQNAFRKFIHFLENEDDLEMEPFVRVIPSLIVVPRKGEGPRFRVHIDITVEE